MNYEIEVVAGEPENGCETIMAILGRGVVTNDDLNQLRRGQFAEGIVNQQEAEALFALERTGIASGAGWVEFFVEAITDYAVWQLRPTGIVTDAQGEWLLEQVDRTKSATSLAALCNVLAEADQIPAWLPAAAHGRMAAGWDGVSEALEAARVEQLAA